MEWREEVIADKNRERSFVSSVRGGLQFPRLLNLKTACNRVSKIAIPIYRFTNLSIRSSKKRELIRLLE